eukprot:scaffold710_cov171-Amphora_coffeaeformis.AAC.30
MSFDKSEECLTYIQGNAELSQHEEQLSRNQQSFDVSAWMLYLDRLDEIIGKNDGDSTNISWHVRDFVGRRALLALPRSYKLWKTHWEFVLMAEKRQIFDTETHQRWGEAAVQYQVLLNESATAQRDEYWQAFSTLCTQHPVQVEQAGVPWEDIVRAVLKEEKSGGSSSTNTLGQEGILEGFLWTQLADSWIRRGSFDLARSVYEEGLQKVRTVRDFSLLYDAYLQFEEGMLQAEGDLEDDNEEEGNQAREEAPGDWDILLEGTTTSKLADLELAMARAEHLTSRRPLLLNAVMLRQDSNNVEEWLTRSDLYTKLEQAGQAIAVLEEALKMVQATRATHGKPSQIVVKLGKLYEEKDVTKARELMQRICGAHEFNFVKSEDLAESWAFWIEMELRQESWDEALSLARQAVAPGSGTKKLNLTKSLRLWDLLFDLEESLGTVQSTKDAYNRSLEIKAATVQHVLNFAEFLIENKYFEEAFSVYERGIEMFSFPHPGAKSLWKAYLAAFLDRYAGTKTTKHLGITSTREIYQDAVDNLKDKDAAKICIDFAKMETTLQEYERARAIYAYGAQMADPRRMPEFYKAWHEFEIDYGNEETFREMLRVKRSVEAAFSTVNYNAKGLNEAVENLTDEQAMQMIASREGVDIEANAQKSVHKFVPATKRTPAAASLEDVEARVAKIRKIAGEESTAAAATTAPVDKEVQDDDEIDLDEIDAEIEAAAAEGAVAEEMAASDRDSGVKDVRTKAVPAAVFGGLATKAKS